jgi:pantetheine-phosphate adenylyltransferase
MGERESRSTGSSELQPRVRAVAVFFKSVAFCLQSSDTSRVPNSRIAIYAGSFDPITRGHEDLMRRSLEFVDRLVVAVAINSAKTPLFSVDERVALIRETVQGESRIDVHSFGGLLVDFARDVGASLLIRGLRAVSDFEYEYQMALMNRHLSPRLETVFMVPSLDTTYISASLVREVARYGGEVSDLVHPTVAQALRARLGESTGGR